MTPVDVARFTYRGGTADSERGDGHGVHGGVPAEEGRQWSDREQAEPETGGALQSGGE